MRTNDISVLKKIFSFTTDVLDKSLKNASDCQWVVYNPAYKDMTPRTLSGSKKERVSSALNNLSEGIYNYLNDKNEITETEYNEWHKKICDTFINDFQKGSGLLLKYGKAQKIVNMSMKYCYCFSDSLDYQNKFKFCHMPLDSYTINWFCDDVVPLINKGKNRKDKVSVTKLKETSWSNLECGDEKSMYSYLWLQHHIKEYLNSKDNTKYRTNDQALTPFEAEFYIWPEQQFKQAYESLIRQAGFIENCPGYSDVDIYNCCDELIQELSNYKNKVEPIN